MASATCLTSFDLRAGTPVVLTGVGAAAAQSFAEQGFNRTLIRDNLLLGTAPSAIISALATFDAGHQSRQYGIASVTGGPATFTGTGAGAWAGGRTGTAGDLHYAVQGNVLTGAAVVDAAVDAILNTPGDVPAKLMAAMEAARAFGGDGRCSCPSTVTGCGAPPVGGFDLSANIGYVIVARLGDSDMGNGFYRGVFSTGLIAAGQASNAHLATPPTAGPAWSDLAAGSTAGLASVLVNRARTITQTSSVPPSFGVFWPTQVLTVSGLGGSVGGLVLADVNRDGRIDLTSSGEGGFYVSRQPASGAWPAPTRLILTGPASTLALADLNQDTNPDAVVTQPLFTITTLRASATGVYSPLQTILPTPTPNLTSVVAADFSGDGAPDSAHLDTSERSVRIFLNRNDGSGLLDPAPSYVYGPAFTALGLAAGDLDGDGRADLVLGNSQVNTLRAVRNTASGFVASDVATPFLPRIVRSADVDNDGRADVVAVGNDRMMVLRSNAQGLPVLSQTVFINDQGLVNQPIRDVQLADLNNDGFQDAFVMGTGTALLTIPNLGPKIPGAFNNAFGQAAGDYFLNLNVAFAQPTDPDPVLILRSQFDAWRAGLTGTPDAIASGVSIDQAGLRAGGVATLTLTLRDWQSAPIAPAGVTPAIAHAHRSAGVASFGSWSQVSPGVWRVTLSAPASASVGAVDRYRITLTGSSMPRPVQVMPVPTLTVTQGCDTLDFNQDGDFPTPLDLEDFIAANAGNVCATCSSDLDFNNDGDFPTPLDVEAFISVNAGGPCL